MTHEAECKGQETGGRRQEAQTSLTSKPLFQVTLTGYNFTPLIWIQENSAFVGDGFNLKSGFTKKSPTTEKPLLFSFPGLTSARARFCLQDKVAPLARKGILCSLICAIH